MRKVSMLTLGVCLLMTGCADQEAQKRAQTREEVNKALARIQEVNAGYVPKGQGEPGKLEAYQAGENLKAAQNIKKLVSSLPAEQKSGAWQVVANADMQLAILKARTARVEGARVCNNAVEMINRLTSAANAQALAAAYKKSLDGGSTREMESLVNTYKSQLEAEKALAEKLTKDAEALQMQITSLGAEADKLNAGVRELRQQAFVQAGSSQLDLYRKASNIEIDAQRLNTKKQLKSVERDQIMAQLAMVMVNQQSLQQSTDSMQSQLAQLQTRNKELDAKVKVLDMESTRSLSDVLALYNELETLRKKEVEANFNDAVKHATAAVASSEEAAKAAPSRQDQQRYFKLDLLCKRELLIDTIVQALAFEQDYSETLSLVTKFGADQGVPVSDLLLEGPQRFAKAQKELGRVGWEQYRKAAALVTELTPSQSGDEEMMAKSTAAYNRLQSLEKALTQLAPGQDVGPAPSAEAPSTGGASAPATQAPAEGAAK